MEITNINTFLKYWQRIRQRTMKLVAIIPPDKIEWTYQTGKFTLGDIVRHLGAIERYMYAENVQLRPSRYQGCGVELAEGYDDVVAFLNRMHEESMAIFAQLTPEDLQRRCLTPGGAEIPTWKWLRAMVEHEVHHRGQLYMYLAMLNVPTPPVFGLTSEQVIERSTQ